MVHIMDVGSGDGPDLTKRTGDMNQTSSPDAPLKINGNSIHLRAAVFFSCIGGFLFGYEFSEFPLVYPINFVTNSDSFGFLNLKSCSDTTPESLVAPCC